MATEQFVPLNRAQLKLFLPNQESIRAFEKLFSSAEDNSAAIAALEVLIAIAQATADAALAKEAFPINSVYVSISPTNPNAILGYGTWTQFGAGRVLVGVDPLDTDFDTVEEIGGSKTTEICCNC